MSNLIRMLSRLVKPMRIEGASGSLYLIRYRLIKNPWFGIYLHHFFSSDTDDAHDHPWAFASIILRGGYFENTTTLISKYDSEVSSRWYRPGSILFRRATHIHTITLKNTRSSTNNWLTFDDVPLQAWSLVIHGPARRDWGFHTLRGFVPWKTYMDKKFGANKWIPA